jgi:hypothetical protein
MISRRVLLLTCLLFSSGLPAATPAAAGISGLREQPELAFPSMTRVVVAVVITLGLAAGAIVLLKRLVPGMAVRRTQGGDIKVLAHTNVTTSLRAHVLEIDATRVLIVEGRNGIGLALLPRVDCSEKPESP